MTEQYVNIDLKPEVVVELPAKVEVDERGKPTLVPLSPERWRAYLGRLAGKMVRVAVSRIKARRSLKQNAYLWSVVYPHVLEGLRAIAAEAGGVCPIRDVDRLHVVMKHRFIPPAVIVVADEEFEVPPTTTELDIEQFSNYVTLIQAWAAQKGVYIPAPGEEGA